MEFCLSVPTDQYFRDGKGRWLIRRAMRDLMPAMVLDETRRGRQATDIGRRTQIHYEETEAALRRVERSDLANHYLNVLLMRLRREHARQRLDIQTTRTLGSIFFRGLMVDLFLQRFEKKR